MTRPESAPGQKLHRLVAVTLDEASIGRSGPDVEHERAAAIYDLLEDNSFAPVHSDRAPFKLHLSITGSRLVFDIRRANDTPMMAHLPAHAAPRIVVFPGATACARPLCAGASGDMGRRALHDEGSQLLMERLKRKVMIDFGTARRLFTLICVLHWKG
jgi:uncharacterized protein (UPF0262 family)